MFRLRLVSEASTTLFDRQKAVTLRLTPHCSDGPGVAGHGTLRVLDVPRRRHGRVAAPRRHVHVHRLDVQTDRISRVSGRTPATLTDLLYLDIVQQESGLVANSSDSDSGRRVGCGEVIHVLLPFARCRYRRHNDEYRMEPWELDKAELLRMEAVAVRGMDIESNPILLCLL